MSRIVFVSPDTNVPTGGIKVIYKHVEMLHSMGIESAVLHFTRGFRCDWFANTVPVIYPEDLRMIDFVIVPEIMPSLGNQLHEMGLRFGMYVQNGYLVMPSAPLPEVIKCYQNASVIFSISVDTSGLLSNIFPEFTDKIIRIKYSVDSNRFKPAEKKARTATYMPRKVQQHVCNVVPWLSKRFPDWTFQQLHGITEDLVAESLSQSRVFLAFSDFEGCPIPPIEAALAGNIVLGYHGWGGQEYWREPNFMAVNFGDIRDFVRKFREVAAFSAQPDIDRLLAPGMALLSRAYGPQSEKELLLEALEKIGLRP